MKTGIVVALTALALAVPAVAVTTAQDDAVTNEFGTPCASQPATPGASPAASPDASPMASPDPAEGTPAATVMGGCATAEAGTEGQ